MLTWLSLGEGRLDRQSLAGESAYRRSKKEPLSESLLSLFVGSLAEDLPSLPFENIQAAFSILEKSEPLEDSLKNASLYLEHTATNIGHLLRCLRFSQTISSRWMFWAGSSFLTSQSFAKASRGPFLLLVLVHWYG